MTQLEQQLNQIQNMSSVEDLKALSQQYKNSDDENKSTLVQACRLKIRELQNIVTVTGL
jgi:hypothetical protein